MLTADYHMHSVSPDARVPMEDMCQAAIDKGLTEVALTDHYEFYAHGIHRKFFHEEYLKMYLDSLERCRERFAGQLTIKSGMEFGQLHLTREEAFNIIRNHPFDYLIGSVHKIENVDVSKNGIYRCHRSTDHRKLLPSSHRTVCLRRIRLPRTYRSDQTPSGALRLPGRI